MKVFQKVKAIMMFVDDVPSAVKWYAELLSVKPYYIEPNVPILKVGEVALWFHKADSKVSSGTAGMVTYGQVENFEQAINLVNTKGGKMYRGPLAIENNESICQIIDPFGNLIGLCGPSNQTQ